MLDLTTALFLMVAVSGSQNVSREMVDLGQAIVETVDTGEPPRHWDDERAVSELVVYAWEESRFKIERTPRADLGVHKYGSVCAFQVMARSEDDARQLETDIGLCTRRAFAIMRESVRICGDLSLYCGGCNRPLPTKIAAWRKDKARRLMEQSRRELAQVRSRIAMESAMLIRAKGPDGDERAHESTDTCICFPTFYSCESEKVGKSTRLQI